MLIPIAQLDQPGLFFPNRKPPGNYQAATLDGNDADYDFVLNEERGTIINSLRDNFEMTATTPDWGVDANGVHTIFSANENNKFSGSGSPLVTSDGSGNGDFAFIVAGYFVREVARRVVLSQRSSSLSAAQLTLITNATSISGTSAGYIQVYTNASGATRYESADGIPDTGFHVIGFSRVGTTGTLFRDGVNIGSSIGTVRDIAGSSQSFSIGGYGPTTGTPFSGRLHLVRLFNRAIPDDAMIAMTQHPFRFMTP